MVKNKNAQNFYYLQALLTKISLVKLSFTSFSSSNKIKNSLLLLYQVFFLPNSYSFLIVPILEQILRQVDLKKILSKSQPWWYKVTAFKVTSGELIGKKTAEQIITEKWLERRCRWNFILSKLFIYTGGHWNQAN